MKKAENAGEGGCLQRDSTECKEYAGTQSAVRPEAGETEVRESRLLERILFRDNMNRAYKRVKANKGAPGVDGMPNMAEGVGKANKSLLSFSGLMR